MIHTTFFPSLIEAPKVSQLFCLVQTGANINALRSSNKVAIVTGDLAEAKLGLNNAEFSRLSVETDLILRFGANRSFWDDYSALRRANPNAVEDLVRLALTRRIPFHMMSSGAAGILNDSTARTLYEANATLPASDISPKDGSDSYVASKLAAERFLTNVSEQLHLPVVLHQFGPVPGLGPNTDDAELESDEMINEYLGLTNRDQARPALCLVDGWLDLVPVPANLVSRDITAAVLDRTSHSDVTLLSHTATSRTAWA